MQVKIGDLKNNLSRYLKRLERTGEDLTILDRNKPIARITRLRGARGAKGPSWIKERSDLLARASKKGIKLSIPESEPQSMGALGILPTPAPDGKTNIDTVLGMRKEKDY
jgi:antitoxin (DNA-binding transcriptional repressor) of toxin-antitoxin stability system